MDGSWLLESIPITFPRKMAILQHMPWLSRILFQFSFGTESATRMTEFCQEQARKRATRGSTRKDLFYHLVSLLY